MALMDSASIALGTSAPTFSLPGIDGKMHSLEDFLDKKVLVIILMCNHCPYVQAQWKRFVETERAFRERGVQFVAINPNDVENYPEDSMEKMQEYAAQYGHTFPYLRDDSQDVAKAYGAVCTPDIFVYDEDRTLAYHGRLDDNWRDENKVTSHDLAAALEAMLGDKKPTAEQFPSMGCSIKWR